MLVPKPAKVWRAPGATVIVTFCAVVGDVAAVVVVVVASVVVAGCAGESAASGMVCAQAESGAAQHTARKAESRVFMVLIVILNVKHCQV